MEQTTTTTTTTNAAPAQRPTMLTVLCILSFIFGGIAIIMLVIALLGMGAVSAGASMLENAGGTTTYTGPSTSLTWAYLIVGFLTAIVSLYGVIKMWKLEKMGFFLYTGATVVSIIMGVVYSGFGIMSIVPLVFVVLYGLNLKYMR